MQKFNSSTKIIIGVDHGYGVVQRIRCTSSMQIKCA